MTEKKKHIDLNKLPKENIFPVPDTYFENLPDAILRKIEAQHPLSKEVFRKNIYSIPENYFEDLPSQIEKKVLPKGLLDPEGMKANILKSPEESYFDQLPYALQEKVNGKKESWKPGWNVQPVLRYAMAASVMIAILACSWWIYRSQQQQTGIAYDTSHPQADAETLIAQLDRKDIKAYLENHHDHHEEEIIEAAVKSSRSIHHEIEKSIPLNKIEKEIIQEELELEDIDELDLGEDPEI